MTAQRARHSASRDILFPQQDVEPDGRTNPPDSPRKAMPKTLRKISSYGSLKIDEPGPIVFREMPEEERVILLDRLKASAAS